MCKLTINNMEKSILKKALRSSFFQQREKLREASLKLDFFRSIPLKEKSEEQIRQEKALIECCDNHLLEIKELIDSINKL
jgi:succinate dehydrogenase flavin-adding protein (antitoxin of CptAB toxin-antitoxin module)